MAVSLVHQYLVDGMTPRSPSPTCAAIDLFDELDDDELERWAAAATVARRRAGRRRRRAGREPPGLQLLLEGEVRDALESHGDARRARRPPATRRPGWARSPRSPATRSASACAPRPTAASRCIPPEDFRRLALAHPAVHRARHAAGRAGDAAASPAIEHDRERLAVARARWPRGSRTSSTTRRRPRAAPRRSSRRRMRRRHRRGRRVRRRRRRARGGGACSSACSARRWTAWRARHGARRARRRRRRGRAARAPRGPRASPTPGARRARSPPPASTRRGCERVVASGRPGDRRPGAALDRRDADRRSRWPPSCRSPRAGCPTSSAR